MTDPAPSSPPAALPDDHRSEPPTPASAPQAAPDALPDPLPGVPAGESERQVMETVRSISRLEEAN